MEAKKIFKSRSIVLAPDGSRTTVLEWLPLISAFRDTVEWVLDIAADIAADYPDEVAAVHRVRSFLRHRMAGYPATLRLQDVLFTVGLVLAAIERDLGPLKGRERSFSRPIDWSLAFELARLGASAAESEEVDETGRVAA